MKQLFLFLAAGLLLCGAQAPPSTFYCNYLGDGSPPSSFDNAALGLPLERTFKAMLDTLLDKTANEKNGLIFQSGHVSNAMASYREADGKFYIIYNYYFLKDLYENQGRWAVYAVLAHELAHHLKRHFFFDLANPEKERQADRWAGHALCILGAPPGVAEKALVNADSNPTEKYDGKAARIAKMEAGYMKHCENRPVPSATLLLQSPLRCTLLVDGEAKGMLQPNQSRRIPVRPGEHNVQFVVAPAIALQHDVRVEPAHQKWLEADWSAELPLPEMKRIRGGTFTMGSNDGGGDEKPPHRVTVSDFDIGIYEVTFAEYDAFCEATGRSKPDDQGWGRGRRPVINVSWNDATAYAAWLSEQTGQNWRLPTEAEWEYAAGGGSSSRTKYAGTAAESSLSQYGNFCDATCDLSWKTTGQNDGAQYTARVGSYRPNALGLYDMSGNVWEWCQDWYGSDYYASSPISNPQGPATGSSRVLRGGSWRYYPRVCRVANRSDDTPARRYGRLGFRLARTP